MVGCPLTFEVRRIVSGEDKPLTSHETAALTHFDLDGSLKLFSADTSLIGEVWTIKLFAKSTYSKSSDSEGAYKFDITFSLPNTAPKIQNLLALFEVNAN